MDGLEGGEACDLLLLCRLALLMEEASFGQ